MTTARQPRQPGSSPGVAGRVVRRALLATLVLGALLAAVGGAVSGAPALVGVLVGTALVCVFFGLGTMVLTWVTKVSPAASLLVGLMTYTLQVIVLGLVFAVLQASGLMGSTIDGTWLGCTVIAGTFLWLAIQVPPSACAPASSLRPPGRGRPRRRLRTRVRRTVRERSGSDGGGCAMTPPRLLLSGARCHSRSLRLLPTPNPENTPGRSLARVRVPRLGSAGLRLHRMAAGSLVGHHVRGGHRHPGRRRAGHLHDSSQVQPSGHRAAQRAAARRGSGRAGEALVQKTQETP